MPDEGGTSTGGVDVALRRGGGRHRPLLGQVRGARGAVRVAGGHPPARAAHARASPSPILREAPILMRREEEERAGAELH
jgi:hypothetical protein